ncbi:hypothetical protein Phpb_01219 [Photorhabdus namnaonensis]|uniref:Uncharacterized protein n=1 Tax=Photorhabdus namnaonensis TaxID=1851568 RepID=A0A1B8YKT0_9GAMM|nr:hypothetical protein Phpb_01219 [Photorhabdus namnaonensis]
MQRRCGSRDSLRQCRQRFVMASCPKRPGLSMHNVPVKWTKQGFCKPYATPSSRQLSDSLPIMTT